MNTIVDLSNALSCVQGNNPRSISFMIQTTTTSTAVFVSTGGNIYAGSFTIGASFYNTDKHIIQIDAYNIGYYPTNTGKVINDGLWHTVLVSYDGTTISIYVDGILDNTAAHWNTTFLSMNTSVSTLNTTGNSRYLGADIDGFEYTWIGKMKNVNFYDYVISNTYALANNYQSAGGILYTSGNCLYV